VAFCDINFESSESIIDRKFSLVCATVMGCGWSRDEAGSKCSTHFI